MKLPTLVAIAAAFDVETQSIVPIPEANCAECEYDRLPHEGGHCYMFEDPPEDNRCGAFEPTRMSMEWKT